MKGLFQKVISEDISRDTFSNNIFSDTGDFRHSLFFVEEIFIAEEIEAQRGDGMPQFHSWLWHHWG